MLKLSIGPRADQRPADDWWLPLAVLGHHPIGAVDAGGRIALPTERPALSVDGRMPRAWSLDWAVNTAERWYAAADEPSLRQRRVGPGLVAETAMRVESGDIRQRAYAAVADGRQVIAVEFHNDLTIPVALALAIRPYGLRNGGVNEDGPNEDALSCDDLIRRRFAVDDDVILIDGQAALVLPRAPAEMAVSDSEDLLADLRSAPVEGDGITSPSLAVGDGPAGPEGSTGSNALLVLPLPHNAVVRIVILPPVDATADDSNAPPGPALAAAAGAQTTASDVSGLSRQVVDSETVAGGWASVVTAGARFTFPDPGVTDLFASAAGTVIAEAASVGQRVRQFLPGAGHQLKAMAMVGYHSGVASVMAEIGIGSLPGSGGVVGGRWPAGEPWRIPRKPPHGAGAMAEIVAAFPYTLACLRPDRSTAVEVASELVAHAVPIVRAVQRSKDADALATAEWGLAWLAAMAGDLDGARQMLERLERDQPPAPPMRLEMVGELATAPSPLHTWHDGHHAHGGGAAQFVIAARNQLIDDSVLDNAVSLFPAFPASWRGGNLQVEGAPVLLTPNDTSLGAGTVGFAVRWHGARPALLWELMTPAEPHETATANGAGHGAPAAVTLRAPGLDPQWSSDDPSGETLLLGVADELPAPPTPGASFQ